jgi:cyclophilin family peptidyl-prolyl cis-trans isomerase
MQLADPPNSAPPRPSTRQHAVGARDCRRLVLPLMLIAIFGAQWSFGTARGGAQAAPASKKQIAKNYEQAAQKWRETLKELLRIKLEHSTSRPANRKSLQKEWIDQLGAQLDALWKVHDTGADAYNAHAVPLADLEGFLVRLVEHDVNNGRYEWGYQLASRLREAGCIDTKLDDLYGNAAFSANRFNEAKVALERKFRGQTDVDRTFLDIVERYQTLWKEEEAIREKEADDDLPRVLLQTTKGDIVLELFENEAPATVGNFIYLVDKGFYNGLKFHNVERGFVAQSGCPDGTGKGGPGYSIYCECYQANRRNHFGGTVAMAKVRNKAGESIKHSGGSQFSLNVRPAPHLNGSYTAFGRVIEGLNVITLLQVQGEDVVTPEGETPARPDVIIKAKVLRRRAHEYLPNRVQN